MALLLQLPQAAARLWSIPEERAKIMAMHAKGMPLLDMVSELGLEDALDADGLRDVIDQLSPDEVQLIRDAFIEEAMQTEKAGAFFPIDCRVDDLGNGVTVEASRQGLTAERSVVRINQAGSQT
jgi:hypothetical protein